MFKIGLTAVVTAIACFALTAATGLARSPKEFKLQVGDLASFKAANLYCQVTSKTQIACGAPAKKNSIVVYYEPHRLAVVKFTGTRSGQNLFQIRR